MCVCECMCVCLCACIVCVCVCVRMCVIGISTWPMDALLSSAGEQYRLQLAGVPAAWEPGFWSNRRRQQTDALTVITGLTLSAHVRRHRGIGSCVDWYPGMNREFRGGGVSVSSRRRKRCVQRERAGRVQQPLFWSLFYSRSPVCWVMMCFLFYRGMLLALARHLVVGSCKCAQRVLFIFYIYVYK